MKTLIGKIIIAAALALLSVPANAGQFVVELNQPIDSKSLSNMTDTGIVLDETLAAGADSYAVFSAPDAPSLEAYLEALSIKPEKISEVLFINSPTVGGGQAADTTPRPNHDVYVIERPIPGVGFLGLDKKRKISKNSNAAIAKLGTVIEWDHSYLTSEGTYCVYRADSPETLREHGALAGAPIGKITAVHQKKY